ncbi:MAG TPA: hypothetical protein VJB59_09945 [Bdellovibrionota bacterium]|nr:hypothetical protein [Bdellovibrionota bacterium]
MKIEHWMTFGTFAEQRYFIYPKADTYSGVVINANMAAHAPQGLAAFLLEKTKNLNYIVDPLTHAFQHDPEAVMTTDKDGNRAVKTSIQTLANAYGAPVTGVVGKRPLNPDDLKDEKILDAFVKGCLSFQTEQLTNAMNDTDVVKYLDESERKKPPYAVVAPYFYMTETTVDRWLPICTSSARIAINSKIANKVFAAIVVSQGVILDDQLIEKIANSFSTLNLAGYLLWVDGLNEQEAGGAELKGLLALARKLRANNTREVINLHGGYFSILAAGTLGNEALSGVAHGPEFGEYRSVVPVGGGIPIARYYVPLLHSRIRYREAMAALRFKGWLDSAEKFHANVCNCQECMSVLDGKPENFVKFGIGNVKMIKRGANFVRLEFPTKETKEHCLRHYLNVKVQEYAEAVNVDKTQIISNLDKGLAEFGGIMGIDAVSYLDLWKQVLTAK